MGADIAYLVLTLSEDATIASFESRKAELRRQVEAAGGDAVTVYAADKLSDIRGLRRAIEFYGDALPKRLGTSVATLTDHYRESVRIDRIRQQAVVLPARAPGRARGPGSRGRLIEGRSVVRVAAPVPSLPRRFR